MPAQARRGRRLIREVERNFLHDMCRRTPYSHDPNGQHPANPNSDQWAEAV